MKYWTKETNTRRGEENGGPDKDKYNRFVCVFMCVCVRARCFRDRGRWEGRRVGDRNMKNSRLWLETITHACTHTHRSARTDVALSLDYSHVWWSWSGIWWCWKYHSAEYVSSLLAPSQHTLKRPYALARMHPHTHACVHAPQSHILWSHFSLIFSPSMSNI